MFTAINILWLPFICTDGCQDKYFGGDHDVTREMVLDDSWEDKTGLVKVWHVD